MRAWAQRNDKKAFTIDNSDYFELDQLKTVVTYQYSFVGPLSMQKGCDNAFHMFTKTIDGIRNKPPNNGISFETNKLSYRGLYVCPKCCWSFIHLKHITTFFGTPCCTCDVYVIS